MDLNKTPVKRSVHIVDDDAELREALVMLFSTAQIDSRTHPSAEAFLEAVPLSEPICLILDKRLPGMDGLELLRRISQSGSEAVVIMMTGHGDVPTAVAAMKLGAFHFVEKPFDAEGLLSTVEEAVSRTEQVHDLHAEAQAFAARRKLLTAREDEVFELLIDGLPTKAVASRLDITARTAEHHRAAVMRKLGARSIAHLMRMALSFNKLLPVENHRDR
jgi:FixJ family two-component response regulator